MFNAKLFIFILFFIPILINANSLSDKIEIILEKKNDILTSEQKEQLKKLGANLSEKIPAETKNFINKLSQNKLTLDDIHKNKEKSIDLGEKETLNTSDIVLEMVTELNIETEERIIGEKDFLPADFFLVATKRQKIVARIVFAQKHRIPYQSDWVTLYPGEAWGTGFLLSPTLFMTNNHVIDNKEIASKLNAQFNYQNYLSSNTLKPFEDYEFDPEDFFYTNEALDFTLIRLKPKETSLFYKRKPGDAWGYYNLADSLGIAFYSMKDSNVNIIQHPQGRPKEIAIHNNVVEEIYSNVIRYTADTEPGSSGSAVFDNDWTLVALHHAAGDYKIDNNNNIIWLSNEGIRIDKIIKNLQDNVSEDILKELNID